MSTREVIVLAIITGVVLGVMKIWDDSPSTPEPPPHPPRVASPAR